SRCAAWWSRCFGATRTAAEVAPALNDQPALHPPDGERERDRPVRREHGEVEREPAVQRAERERARDRDRVRERQAPRDRPHGSRQARERKEDPGEEEHHGDPEREVVREGIPRARARADAHAERAEREAE